MSELGSEGARHALGRDGAREAGRREVGRESEREWTRSEWTCSIMCLSGRRRRHPVCGERPPVPRARQDPRYAAANLRGTGPSRARAVPSGPARYMLRRRAALTIRVVSRCWAARPRSHRPDYVFLNLTLNPFSWSTPRLTGPTAGPGSRNREAAPRRRRRAGLLNHPSHGHLSLASGQPSEPAPARL